MSYGFTPTPMTESASAWKHDVIPSTLIIALRVLQIVVGFALAADSCIYVC